MAEQNSKHANNVEIQKYHLLLKACKLLGGDIKRYQELKFSIPQLIEILKGLENKVDVNYYLDPKLSPQKMEILRKGLKEGISLKMWLEQGFDWAQLEQIYLGYKAGVAIEHYGLLDYNPQQMEQLRLGLLEELNISYYESPDFSASEMLEIRKGLQNKLDVSKYAKKEYDAIMMREIRRSLQDDFDFEKYLNMGVSSKVLRQLRKSTAWGYDILPYVEDGYNADQIEQISMCLQQQINIKPYLTITTDYRQIREIRLGFEAGLDVSLYGDNKFKAEQMEQIRLGLEQGLEVSVYADSTISASVMNRTREKLLFAKESAHLVNDMLALSEDEIKASMEAEAAAEEAAKEAKEKEAKETEEKDNTPDTNRVPETTVEVSPDGMIATLSLAPPETEAYRLEQLVALLGEQNIRQGLNLSSLQMILKNKAYNQPVVVARGKEPVNGKDGYFTYHFNTDTHNHKPTILPDGSVDYFNSSAYEFTTKNQLLAEYTPATPGEYGYTVTGKLMIPKRGKDLPVLRGKGFVMSEDHLTYRALNSGQIEFQKDKLNIINCLSVQKDLDLSVGNINFDGNVEISGNVIPNMVIRATGYVKVNGYVEAATIYAGGDVVLAKGIQGGGISYIESGGNVSAPFFESTTIKCEGCLNSNHILNCDVTSMDSVLLSGKRGLILGGITRALCCIDANTVGNRAELPTRLVLGVDAEVIKEYGDTMQTISKIKLELSALRKNMVIFEEQGQTEHYTYLMLQKAIQIKEDDLAKQKEQLENCNSIIETSANSFAGFRKNVYPGTSISINAERHTVKEEQHNVTYRLRDRKVIMEEYQEPSKKQEEKPE